jgi:hypothetical protein
MTFLLSKLPKCYLMNIPREFKTLIMLMCNGLHDLNNSLLI